MNAFIFPFVLQTSAVLQVAFGLCGVFPISVCLCPEPELSDTFSIAPCNYRHLCNAITYYLCFKKKLCSSCKQSLGAVESVPVWCRTPDWMWNLWSSPETSLWHSCFGVCHLFSPKLGGVLAFWFVPLLCLWLNFVAISCEERGRPHKQSCDSFWNR